MMDSGAVSKSKVGRSYAPVSFYMDSTVANKLGPIIVNSKNSIIRLSSYTTTLIYHARESKIDLFVANEEDVRRKYHPLSFYMDPAALHPGRLRVHYNSGFPGWMRVNYTPLSMGSIFPGLLPINYIMASTKSQPKVMFRCFDSQSSQSISQKLKICFGSFGSQSSQLNSGPMGKGHSSRSKVSRTYIPDKVAFSILSKLSIKSLKRFACVCKSWSTLFENADFMTMYSKHFISRHGSDDDYHTFILTHQLDDDDLFYSEFHLLDNKRKFNVPSPLQVREKMTCILGSTSVNGIFCLGVHSPTVQKSQYALWNPLTEELWSVPPSPTELTPRGPRSEYYPILIFHGFGYDQLRDDFKVIQYIQYEFGWCPSNDRYSLLKCFVEIYSLKSNSWRMIDMEKDLCQSENCYANSLPFNGFEVYVDGVCHWLVSKFINGQDALALLSFDLSDEVFLTTAIGEEPDSPYNGFRRLMVLNGSIALISNYHDDVVFHISILGELGVSESWIKLYIYGPLPSIEWPPIGFGKMGYLFVTKKDYEVAYVDLSSQIIEEVGNIGENTSYFNCGLYKESRLSLEDQVTSFCSSCCFHP